MEEIYLRLLKMGLSPNTLYVLHCINKSMVPANFVNAKIETKRLVADNWLTESLKLTQKSIIFMEEIDGFFKKTKKKTSTDLMGSDFAENMQTYVEIFPNRKLPSGKYARTTIKNLESSFKWFFENYYYSWDIILLATEKYVDEFSINSYNFMRTSQYFVRKQNIDKSFDSELANYCDIVLSKEESDDDNYFKERVV
tara:strand:- start:224 stop:814 length:591 start_codon:yes stop_codon:yes gene_type:complete